MKKCYFCSYVGLIHKMKPVVKNIRDWEMVSIGGYVCDNRECQGKVVFPYYVER